MWMLIAQILGLSAVGLFLLSFQFKKRGQIVFITCISNSMFVIQYLMLGAYSGAAMDFLSTLSSLLASQKNQPKFRRFAKVAAVGILSLIFVTGLFLAAWQKKPIELLAMVGALLQTMGLWFNKEQTIRKFGLAGTPFWLAYNFLTNAYGAAIGTMFTMTSILIALLRYRKKRRDF